MPNIQLELSTPKSTEESLCRYKNLSALLRAVQSHLFVAGGLFDRAVVAVRSTAQPNSSERGDLWISPTIPAFVGIFASGKWRKVYEYPVGVAFPWVLSTDPPSYLQKISNTQVASLGLSSLSAGQWVVFNPEGKTLAS
jgi:hypothetical protein|tara:strand:- start:6614 stop:7030 length:417 start_codon:yes stop_codon:yes gene_type:complete